MFRAMNYFITSLCAGDILRASLCARIIRLTTINGGDVVEKEMASVHNAFARLCTLVENVGFRPVTTLKGVTLQQDAKGGHIAAGR